MLRISNHWGWSNANILDITGGVFNHNNGTLRLQPQGNNSVNFPLVIPNGLHFYNIIVDVNGGNSNTKFTVTAGDTLYAENDFQHNDGRIDGLCALEGNLILDTDIEDGNGWLIFTGVNDQTWEYTGTIKPTAGIKVEKSSGVVAQKAGTTDLYCSRFAMSSGTFEAPSNLLRISNHWGWSNVTIFSHTSGGVFSHNNGTVSFMPSGNSGRIFTVDVLPGDRFNNVISDVGNSDNCYLNIAATDTIYANNNFSFKDGKCNGGNIAVEGNVTVNSEFYGGSSRLNFLGSNSQTFDLTGATTRFNGDVKIDKPSDNVTLLSECQLDAINQDMYFENGKFITTSTNLMIIGDNVDVYNVSNNSHIDGPARKIGNDAFTFPVGNDGFYAAISMSAPSSTSHHFTAQYFHQDADNAGDRTALAGTLNHISFEEYWTLDRTNGNSNVEVTLSWDDVRSGGVDNLTTLRVAHWDGSIWTDEGNGGITGSNLAGTVVSSAPVTSFSPFTLASTRVDNPLPVTLLSFTGDKLETSSLLKWVTQTEVNNNYFELERSTDGVNYKTISKINGAGNSNVFVDYYFEDKSPYIGINYYRLKQVDFDEKYEYYNPISIEFNGSANLSDINLYPNPATNSSDITITYNGFNNQSQIQVIDIKGSLVNIAYTASHAKIIINTTSIDKGVYFVIISTDTESKKKMFIVE